MNHIPLFLEAGLRHIFLFAESRQEIERQNYVNNFMAKWGGWDYAHLLPALNSEDPLERAFAVAVLYQLDKQNGEVVLRSMLNSEDPWVRWSSGLILGTDKHTDALVYLGKFLVEYLTREHFQESSTSNFHYYFLNWRLQIPQLLAKYHNVLILPYVRKALFTSEFLLTEALSQNLSPEERYFSWLELIEYYQVMLVYLAGRFKAWGLTFGVTTDQHKIAVWSVIQSYASLEQKNGLRESWEIEDMHIAIDEILARKFGFSQEEQQSAITAVESRPLYHDFLFDAEHDHPPYDWSDK